MDIVMVGAGNVATHLAVALVAAGHSVAAIYSRQFAHAEELAVRCGCVATDRLEQLPAADVYIFSVKDDALGELASRLCPMHPEALFLHTAGSVPLDVFRGKARRCGVLYPLQTFSKARAVDFKAVPLFIEASGPSELRSVESLATGLSDNVTELSSDGRRRLHLSAVFACNFVNHCYALAGRQLAEAGLPFRLLLPLIDETAAKVHDLTPEQAQTGPAVRYDRSVIERQLRLLGDGPEADIYRIMSEHIHLRAAEEAAEGNRKT